MADTSFSIGNIEGQVKALSDHIADLLTPEKVTGIQFTIGITKLAGDVWKIGKLVVVNLRLDFSSSATGPYNICSGLPRPKNDGTYSKVMMTNTDNSDIRISYDGYIQLVTGTLSSGSRIISGTYISE